MKSANPTAAATALSSPERPSLDQAVREMLAYFSNNAWFISSYWPENEPRARRMLSDLARLIPSGGTVFEPGCANGFISFLASRIGYRVTATDAWEPEERAELFRRAGVRCFASNLNELDPWPGVPDGSFNAVLFGEVFEHLLNHPVGILKELHRVLKPSGTLLLTTPNPSTLANAVRVLLDRHSLWGTDDFAGTPKLRGTQIIDKGDIHYREYQSGELRRFLLAAGFRVDLAGYMYLDSPAGFPAKRLIKRILGTSVMRHRLFASCNYLIATKV